MPDTATFTNTPKRLNDVDYAILYALYDGRQSITNLSALLPEPHNNSTLKRRMNGLRARGFARKVGPAERSKLYEITPHGVIAGQHYHHYDGGYDELYSNLVERTENSIQYRCIHEIDSLWVELTELELHILDVMQDFVGTGGTTIASDFHEYYSEKREIRTENMLETGKALFALAFYGLAIRDEGFDLYSLTEFGVNADTDRTDWRNGVSLRHQV